MQSYWIPIKLHFTQVIFLVALRYQYFTENSLVERGDIRFRTGLRNKIIEAIYGIITLNFPFLPFPSTSFFR